MKALILFCILLITTTFAQADFFVKTAVYAGGDWIESVTTEALPESTVKALWKKAHDEPDGFRVLKVWGDPVAYEIEATPDFNPKPLDQGEWLLLYEELTEATWTARSASWPVVDGAVDPNDLQAAKDLVAEIKVDATRRLTAGEQLYNTECYGSELEYQVVFTPATGNN